MILHDLIKNPITYWIRWIINKNMFLMKNKRKNIKIDYLSHITNSFIDNGVTIYQYVRLHNVNIGSFTYIANHTTIIGANIGKFCSVGPNCRIGLGMHPTKKFVSTHPIFFSKQSHIKNITFTQENLFKEFSSIDIGNDVWIGANVLIKDGIKINNGAIIGANAIVTRDVPSYSIVAGNPAKVIKYRFTKKEIDFLNDFKWWEKDINIIKKEYQLFSDIKKLMEKYENS